MRLKLLATAATIALITPAFTGFDNTGDGEIQREQGSIIPYVPFSLGAAFRQTVIMFTQFYDPGLEPTTGFGRYFANSIYVVSAATLALRMKTPILYRSVSTPRTAAAVSLV